MSNLPPIPDQSLQHVLEHAVPAGLRASMLREAARACARYLRSGGVFSKLRPESCRFEKNRLNLSPAPTGAVAEGLRRDLVEQELPLLESWGGLLFPKEGDRVKFCLRFFRELSDGDPAVITSGRLWIRQRMQQSRRSLRRRYQQLLEGGGERPEEGLCGQWLASGERDLEELWQELEQLQQRPAALMRGGKRAALYRGDLFGEEVVVKWFRANPRIWRRRFERSRARRAWAAGALLHELKVQTPEALGWLERSEGGRLMECVVISRDLPGAEDARSWLRRRLSWMSFEERVQFRHWLREEWMKLCRPGLKHRDTKLSNLMVREGPDGRLQGWWIDLEDIRPSSPRLLGLIRNFYQLNGSLPRRISREERLAFAAGFQRLYPASRARWVHWVVEKQTRVRLRRELRGECRA